MFDVFGAVFFKFTAKHIESKAVLRHVRVFCWGIGLFWRYWAYVLDIFRVIWGAKMKLTSILRHLVGPMAPPRGFLRAQGCHFGRFGDHFGVIWGGKIKPKSMRKTHFFRAWILLDSGVFRGVCLRHFLVFWGACNERSRKT